MLTSRLARARPLAHLQRAASPLVSSLPRRRWQSQSQSTSQSQAEIEDPGMNGGYINPPNISRQKRDPYGDWWDKQERRNYGEPVHEDNDILGVYAPERYDFYTTPQVAVMWAGAIAVFAISYTIVYMFYPDRPYVDRGFEGGLDRELGGRGTMIARETDGID